MISICISKKSPKKRTVTVFQSNVPIGIGHPMESPSEVQAIRADQEVVEGSLRRVQAVTL